MELQKQIFGGYSLLSKIADTVDEIRQGYPAPEQSPQEVSTSQAQHQRAYEYLLWIYSLHETVEDIQQRLEHPDFDFLSTEELKDITQTLDNICGQTFAPYRNISSVEACTALFSSFIPRLTAGSGSLRAHILANWHAWIANNPIEYLLETIHPFLQEQQILQKKFEENEIGGLRKSWKQGLSRETQAILPGLELIEQSILIQQLYFSMTKTVTVHDRSQTEICKLCFTDIVNSVTNRLTAYLEEQFSRKSASSSPQGATPLESYITNMHYISERVWLLLIAFFDDDRRAQVIIGEKAKLTVFEFLTGLINDSSIDVSRDIKNSTIDSILRPIGNQLITVVNTKFTDVVARHQVTCKKVTPAFIELYMKRLRTIQQFVGDPTNILFQLFQEVGDSKKQYNIDIENIFSSMQEWKFIKQVASEFNDKFAPLLPPESDLWLQYCRSTFWESSNDSSSVFVVCLSLFHWFSVVLLGSNPDQLRGSLSYLSRFFLAGKDTPCFRSVQQRFVKLFSKEKSDGEQTRANYIEKYLVEVLRVVKLSESKSVLDELREVSAIALTTANAQSEATRSPAKSLMRAMV